MTCCYTTNVTAGCHNGQPVAVHFTNDNKGAPAVRILDINGVAVPGADATNTTLGACPVAEGSVTHAITRSTGPVTVAAPFRSLSVTAVSGDVTINGVAVPAGFSWTVSGDGAGPVANDALLDGTDYIVTVVI